MSATTISKTKSTELAVGKPRTVVIRVAAAIPVLRATLAFAGRDDITPAICGTLLTAGDQAITALATDRYRVLSARLPVLARREAVDADPIGRGLDGIPESGIFLPNELVQWIVRTGPSFTKAGYWPSVLELTSELLPPKPAGGQLVRLTARLTHVGGDEQYQEYRTHVLAKHGFPHRVAQLIDDARKAPTDDSPFALNPEFLAQLRVLVAKGEHVQFRPTKQPDPDSGKRGPVHFQTAPLDGQNTYEGLLQPSLDSAFRSAA